MAVQKASIGCAPGGRLLAIFHHDRGPLTLSPVRRSVQWVETAFPMRAPKPNGSRALFRPSSSRLIST